MGLCFSSKDDEEVQGDKTAKDDRQAQGEGRAAEEDIPQDKVAEDDKKLDNKKVGDGKKVENDKKVENETKVENDEKVENDKKVENETKVENDEKVENDKKVEDDKNIEDDKKAQGNTILETKHIELSEDDYIAELCRKYSTENPIPEEEAEIFLKELTFPIPTVPHRTISEDEVAGKRIFVIGDVHGCYDNLLSLLHIADIDKDPNARLIFVGDIINKGPKSCEVLNFVRSSNSYCVMGNHERSAVRKLRLMKMGVGYEPKASKQWMHDLTESDYEYLKELPHTLSIPCLNAIIVHGGLIPGKALEEHSQDEMLLMRNIIKDGNQLKATKHITQGQLWGELWKGPQHVYFGHHALEGLQRYPYATGLDTGCVYHGSLTGVFLTGDKQLVSVQNEGCRNKEKDQI